MPELPRQSYEKIEAEVRAAQARLKELGLIEIVPGDESKPWDEQRWQRTVRGELDWLVRVYAGSVN